MVNYRGLSTAQLELRAKITLTSIEQAREQKQYGYALVLIGDLFCTKEELVRRGAYNWLTGKRA